MRLLKLDIDGNYKGLRDQSFDFSGSSDGIITFVGRNGSGKSQLLELIAEVFGYLERMRRADFRVRKPLPFALDMEYEVHSYIDLEQLKTYRVSIDLAGSIDCQLMCKDVWLQCKLDEIELPQHIVGYASGLNENLQRSFLKNAVQYFDVMSVRAARRKRLSGQLNEIQMAKAELNYLQRHPGIFKLNTTDFLEEEEPGVSSMDGAFPSLSEKDTDIPACIFLDYDCNALLMASLALLPRDQLDALLPEIDYRYPEYICIQYPLCQDSCRPK